MSQDDPHLLLIGGGHSHVAVLADWITNGRPARATLLTPLPTLRYSGMVPGWIAGEHRADDGLVDLERLARRAGVELVLDSCVGIDPNHRIATTSQGREIAFDIASIATGGVGRASSVLGDDPRLLDVRPIDGFVERLDQWLIAHRSQDAHIAVIGAGAGGVELAFGLCNAVGRSTPAKVSLIAGNSGILSGFAKRVRKRVGAELAAQQIAVLNGVAKFEDGVLRVGGASLEPVDLIVAAIGSGAPTWPRESGLECDADGFIAVDQYQRSISHPHILAVGDIASRTDRTVTHSGVHAVHAGPLLAQNLRAMMEGKAPHQSYHPRPASLYLLATGNGSAIASYGPFVAQGLWVARLKSWIDKRWIAFYAAIGASKLGQHPKEIP